MKKMLKLLWIAIETTLLFIFIGATITSITKNIQVAVLVEQFKNRGVLDTNNSTDKIKLYMIESDEEIPTIQRLDENHYYPGSVGDILVSLTSEIEIPMVKEFVSMYAGGHAALVLGDYSDFFSSVDNTQNLEASGLMDVNYATTYPKDTYWVDESVYQEVIGLRVKMDDIQRTKILAEAMAYVGDPYNYAFILDTKNKSYCSDIITKVFSTIGVNLNKDGFTTSVYDLVVTNETYISYYHYLDKNGVRHVYYLN